MNTKQTLSRRTFNQRVATTSACLAAPAAWFTLPTHALAQQASAPIENKDYVRLANAAPVPPGPKIDVIEFFWYGCPACFNFEPTLNLWTKKVPADVAFRRVHVAFSALHETHAKMFYALEAVEALPTMHHKVFNAMHQQRQRLMSESEIVDFVKTGGVDAAKFTEAFRSFGVATKVRQAKQLVEAYRIDGVPSIGIHGRYMTSPSIVGDPIKTLAVTDWLIQRSKSERK